MAMEFNIYYRLCSKSLQASISSIQLQIMYDIYPLVLAVLKVNLNSDGKLTPASSGQVKRRLSNFHKVIWFIAGMKEEPNFLDKMINAGFSTGPSDIYHPLMS